jgi:hypothetical protein
MTNSKKFGFILPVILLLFSSVAYTEVPLVLNYQGKLENAAGAPLDTTLEITFRIYEDSIGGIALWTEVHSGVPVTGGLFDVLIGSVNLLEHSVFLGGNRWLGIQIADNPEGVPRTRMASVPFAYSSLTADAAGYALLSGAPWMINGSNIYFNEGKVGIGTAGPARLLHVYGTANPRILVESPSDQTPEVNLKRGAEEFAMYLNSPGDLAFFADGHDRLVVTDDGNVGIGTADPEQKLHVEGLAHFNAGAGGKFNISTPGGWIGVIAFSKSNHRRDIIFKDSQIQILASTSDAAPTEINGITILEDGSLGVGTDAPQEKLDVDGRIRCKTVELTGGSDIAETFSIVGEETVTEGMVLSIDPENPGALIISESPYDKCVAGVVSGAGGIETGLVMGQNGSEADGGFLVAVTGRVYCLAQAFESPIEPGDLLTTSSRQGHAMKVTDYSRAHGAVIGKSLSRLESGTGLILILVALQ